MKYLIYYLCAVNLVAFCLFGIDKRRAVRGAWRIKERTLFLSAILGGSIGAILGMQVFRHKTKHSSFVFGIPAILICQLAIAAFVIYRIL
jgi:uncharacterized membrane protein YsdA (DUF1294 family)